MRFIPATAFAAALTCAIATAPADAVEIGEHVSPGGIPFWLVEEHAIPIVSFEIEMPGGARLDPEGKDGASRLMSWLFDEGAGEMDSAAFNLEKDALAARYGFSVTHDAFSISAQMLTEKLDESVALLALAISDPRLDADAVERMRALLLSNIADSMQDPNDIASRAFYARVFPDHPYGRALDGRIETVEALTIEDVRAAHDRLVQTAGIRIGIVGDVTPEKAGELLDVLFADVPEGEVREFERTEAAPPPGVEVFELGVPQSVAIFGMPGIYRDDPDFVAAYVMNHILGGGGFESRLMEEVREKRGLAYGVYSYISSRASAALYLGSVQTANERIAESLAVIRAEFERYVTEGITEEELAKAKQYLTGAYPLRFDTNAKIAKTLVAIQEDGLGTEYINIRNDLIDAVTLEDIRRVAERLVRPELMSVVIVGQPEGI